MRQQKIWANNGLSKDLFISPNNKSQEEEELLTHLNKESGFIFRVGGFPCGPKITAVPQASCLL